MTFSPVGFLPRKIVACPPEIGVDHVREIWSVSTCISPGPADGWIQRWLHNRLGLFDTEDLALSIVDHDVSYRPVAYRLWDESFDQGRCTSLELSDIEASSPGPEYSVVGYDAVTEEGYFGHSPLSCNYGARTFAVNMFCLFPTLEEALAGGMKFGGGEWEPGPYCVVEVLRKRGIHSIGG